MKLTRIWARSRLVTGSAVALFLLVGMQGQPGARHTQPSPVELLLAAEAPPDDMCAPPEDEYPSTSPASDPSAGGDLPARRAVMDPYPTFNGLALDVKNNRAVFSDENRKSLLTYPLTAGSNSADTTPSLHQVMGPATELGYIAGVELDPARREIYVANNDIEDRLAVFDYDADGDLKPKRHLYTPHQTWGIALNDERDEMAISVQQLGTINIYRREASGLEPPLRVIKGPHTRMADPHGIRWDVTHHEIAVANHGNSSEITAYSSDDSTRANLAKASAGKFLDPSINFYSDTAQGDVAPLRMIQGRQTKLNWPMGIDFDYTHNEIAVANNGDDSVLIFSRTAKGDAAPLRVIHGPHTGVSSPMAVAIDPVHDELWVANYGDHTALVFSRTANGDAVPKRIIRNAPKGTPTGGFGNPYAVAYDSKRDQLLVPN